MAENKRRLAVWYAAKFIGTQYLWGGDDPIGGFDCSGFVSEVLQSVGALPHRVRLTAQGIFDRFATKTTAVPRAGVIILYRRDGAIRHVEILRDTNHSIGASGGDSATDETTDAIRQNAFVKIRPIGYYSSDYVLVDPFKGG